MIKLIVGLGNPGNKYINTRHNAGFWLIDKILLNYGFNISKKIKFQGFYIKISIYGKNIYFLQPQTYMNYSGKSVMDISNFFQINPNEILVAHDEIDLDSGVIKLKFGGGSAGHNGLKSISENLSTKYYWRLRIGIRNSSELIRENKKIYKNNIINFLLNPICKKKKHMIEKSFDKVIEVIPLIIFGKFNYAMNKLNIK